MTIGERLKELRKKKDLKQSELAKMFELDSSTVSKWETDVYEPDLDVLRKLSNLYGVSIDYILCATDIKQRADELRDIYLFNGDTLTPDEAAELKNYLGYMRWRTKKGNE